MRLPVTESTNNENYWKKVRKAKGGRNLPIEFIHVPKCGGGFVKNVLKSLDSTRIRPVSGGPDFDNRNHRRQGKGRQSIAFAVIRHPVDRFQSLLNYRLSNPTTKPKPLKHAQKDPSISLNEILEKMTDKEILGFKPYRTLSYWCDNIDIFITIDKLGDFLSFFGHEVDLDKLELRNVSKKTRGKLNEANRRRVAKLYAADMALYKRAILD